MNNSIIDMENEKDVPDEDYGQRVVLSNEEKNRIAKNRDRPPGAPPPVGELKETVDPIPLTDVDIPKLVGQIAQLVKSHFQGDIDKLTNDIVNAEDDIRGLEAKLSKEATFSEQIHKDLWSHTHKKPVDPFQPHQG